MIVAGAAIMIAVAAGFAADPSVMVKIIGVGLATAILIDVTIMRMVVVPAAMSALGRWNWWLPGGARRASKGSRSAQSHRGPVNSVE